MANKWAISLAIIAVALRAFAADDEKPDSLDLCPELVAGMLDRLPAAKASFRAALVRTYMADGMPRPVTNIRFTSSWNSEAEAHLIHPKNLSVRSEQTTMGVRLQSMRSIRQD